MPAMKTSPNEAIATLTRHEIDPAFVMRVSLLMNWLQPAHAGTILDVGCGRGFYTEAVARVYPQATAVGVDYNEKPLTLAREQAHAALVSLARSDARALPFPAASFDAVICPDVLEHIVEHDVVLSEVNRVLKEDGLLLITVPHQNYPFVWDPINWVLERAFGIHMPTHIWWLAGIWADHVRLYTTEELSRTMTAAGFTIEETWFTTHRCFPFSLMLFLIGSNIVKRTVSPSLNRYSEDLGNTRWLMWARRMFYAFHDAQPSRAADIPSAGIILKARKRKEPSNPGGRQEL